MRHEQLIIFDLDDTLIDTSDVYWRARTLFVQEMEAEGFDPNATVDTFEDIDSRHIEIFGFAPDRYTRTMQATCALLFREANRQPDPNLLMRIEEHGNTIMNSIPKLIDGARDLLDWAFSHFTLAILTRGDETLQKLKLERSDLSKYFSFVSVVPIKDNRTFLQIMEATNYQPGNTYVIGDSIKSDINPGIEAGATCILFEYQHPEYFWRQEYGVEATGAFYKVHNLRQAIEILKHPKSFSLVCGLKKSRPIH